MTKDPNLWPAATHETLCPDTFQSFWKHQKELSYCKKIRQTFVSTAPGVFFFTLALENKETTFNARCIIPRETTPKGVLLDFHDIDHTARGFYYLSRYLGLGYVVIAPELGALAALNGGFDAEQGPESLAVLKTYRRALTALNAAETLYPQHPIFVSGEGLGGAMALACAALSDCVSACTVLNPLLLDFRTVCRTNADTEYYRDLRDYFRYQDPQHLHENRFFSALDWIDCMNFSSMIQAPFLIGTGRMDHLSPTASQLSLYKNIKSEKQQVLFEKYGHERINFYENSQLYFLLNHLF